MSHKTIESASLVDTIMLGEGELTTLTLAHGSEQYSSDYEAFASIDAELECVAAEDVMTTEEETVAFEETIETEITDNDIEMTDVSEEVSPTHEQVIYTTANQHTQNIIFQAKPTLQRVPISAMQVQASMPQPSQSQSIMIVSPAGGQGASQILKISHPASASRGQLQSIAQSLISAKSGDTNIVHLRTAAPTKTHVVTSHASNITLSGGKAVQTSIKRPAQAMTNRNVYTKMIIAGNQGQSGQEVLIATPQEPQPMQAIKFITSTASSTPVTTITKTLTLAQAQQVGLLSPTKVQQFIPSSTPKPQPIFVNKLIQTSASQPPKLTLIPTTAVKSPAKILPAPTATTQVRPSVQMATFSNAVKTTPQASQKVIIRQNPLKPGQVLGGQVIRIPTNQNISNQVHQIQMPGRQVQYVRLVSTPASTTTNVATVCKPKTTLTTVGVTQKAMGQQQQIVKVVPLNASPQPLRQVAPKVTPTPATGTQRLLIPASTNSATKSVAIPASALSQLASGQAVLSTNSNVGNIVVLPAQYLQQQQQQQQQKQSQQVQTPQTPVVEEPKIKPQPTTPAVLSTTSSQTTSTMNSSNILSDTPKIFKSYSASLDAHLMRPRKPCNCTKSFCLKLYCDCFANGEFCHMCNCTNCSNNLGNEEERQRAIKACLDRNPTAFRPKIGKGRETGDDIRRHNKGCNCKRSGCLKNYCECYEAKIPCSNNCKCIGCRNVEDPVLDKKSLKDLAEAAEARTQMMLNKTKNNQHNDMAFRIPAASNTGARQPFNFLTDKVVEITCQCLMAQAEEADRNMLDEDTSQRLIIEEFGRCLKEIIESANKAEASSGGNTSTTNTMTTA